MVARTRDWPAFSRLFVLGDSGGWSIDEDAAHLGATARRLGYQLGPPTWARFARRQSLFLTSHFSILDSRWLEAGHRLGTAWLHGRPGTPGHVDFDTAYEVLRRRAADFHRVQVTHAEMHDLVLAAGVAPERVFRIPLGVDLENFPLADAERRAEARAALGLPSSAFVVGSFQKDGVGWGDGLEPKLVKGPDVLVGALAHFARHAPELVVLLTGPARGYVRGELDRLGIPHAHVLAGSRAELARAYHALDVYVVPSRQEGGPKAVLESMAAGTPLVSTRVGQAQELVESGVNGLLVDVEDTEGLVAALARVRDESGLAGLLRDAGRGTAEAHALDRLEPQWARLLDGFVALRDGTRAH